MNPLLAVEDSDIEPWVAAAPFVAASFVSLFAGELATSAYQRLGQSLAEQARRNATLLRDAVSRLLADRGESAPDWSELLDLVERQSAANLNPASVATEAAGASKLAGFPVAAAVTGLGFALLVDSRLSAVVLFAFLFAGLGLQRKAPLVSTWPMHPIDVGLHVVNVVGVALALVAT